MSVLPQVLSANAAYAESFGAKSELALPPADEAAPEAALSRKTLQNPGGPW